MTNRSACVVESVYLCVRACVRVMLIFVCACVSRKPLVQRLLDVYLEESKKEAHTKVCSHSTKFIITSIGSGFYFFSVYI